MQTLDIRDLIAQTYRAAYEPALLTAVLDDLGSRLNVGGWHFLGWDREQGVDLIGAVPAPRGGHSRYGRPGADPAHE
jgi:hypothetical protein